MIDLHTHILPGMDDGAKSWEDALEMAQTAAETGTKVLAATCHGNYPGWGTYCPPEGGINSGTCNRHDRTQQHCPRH